MESQELRGQVLLKERLQSESLLLNQGTDLSDQFRLPVGELFSGFIHLCVQEVFIANPFIHSFMYLLIQQIFVQCPNVLTREVI